MKKILLLSAITFISAITVTSCNKNEETIIPEDTRKEVKFTSNIVVNHAMTRMAGDRWNKNDAIGIFMFNETLTAIVEEKINIKYSTQSEGKIGDFEADSETIYFPDNGNKVQFMSYYPHTTSLDYNIYKVDVSNQTNQSSIDLLHSFQFTLYDKATPEPVKLIFDHALTKININVKPGNGLDASDLKDIVVAFEGLNRKANFNLLSGQLTNLSDVNTIIPLKVPVVNGYVHSYEAIVIPTVNLSNALIRIDLQNGDASRNINSDIFSWKYQVNASLSKGTEYTYNITVNRSGLIVEAEINEWIDGGEDNIIAE